MKRYGKIYLLTFFIINIIFSLLVIIIRRNVDIVFPFIKLEFGVLLMSLFVSFTAWIFKLEKGNSIVNIVLGYIILLPALYIMRFEFGVHLFRFTWVIYILMIIVGIIYGIVVLIVSKKYKDEVNELNRLLEKKSEEKNDKNE